MRNGVQLIKLHAVSHFVILHYHLSSYKYDGNDKVTKLQDYSFTFSVM